MTSRLFTGRLNGGDARFLVMANDEIDAGRYVLASLGEPAEITEVPAEGVCIAVRSQLGAWASERVVPNIPLERVLSEKPAAPPV